jgi:hypothetical protein
MKAHKLWAFGFGLSQDTEESPEKQAGPEPLSAVSVQAMSPMM